MGGVLASFGVCMAHRLRHGMGLSSPPSRCDFCQKRLGIQQLIPVLSWLAQRGRCACGRHALPRGLILTEILAVVAGAWGAALLQG